MQVLQMMLAFIIWLESFSFFSDLRDVINLSLASSFQSVLLVTDLRALNSCSRHSQEKCPLSQLITASLEGFSPTTKLLLFGDFDSSIQWMTFIQRSKLRWETFFLCNLRGWWKKDWRQADEEKCLKFKNFVGEHTYPHLLVAFYYFHYKYRQIHCWSKVTIMWKRGFIFFTKIRAAEIDQQETSSINFATLAVLIQL